jgi:uncharacterized protein YjbI with pentapeptide repeats
MDLQAILEDHKLWVSSMGKSGKKAYLRGADLTRADLTRANLLEANLLEANLRGADLRGADLTGANLRGADLLEANLHEANLTWADLTGADLTRANLRGADLRGANLDLSSGIPFHCGGTQAKIDDRIFSQMLYHLTRMDVSSCSGGVKEAIEAIKDMAVSDLFCEYRDDVKPL